MEDPASQSMEAAGAEDPPPPQSVVQDQSASESLLDSTADSGPSHRRPPPPPSPLTGCYLLIVIGEPHSDRHKEIILQKISKGFLSWDVSECHVSLEKELQSITVQSPEGEEARFGERLIQYATENLVTEILIHPQLNTLHQCMKNLLSSFTKHRHIIHAGYTFAGNGSWILQDGTLSISDLVEALHEPEVIRVLKAYENSVTIDVHCAAEGEWTTERFQREPVSKLCKIRINPGDVMTAGDPAISAFIEYLSPFLEPANIQQLLQPTDVVGNIRFTHPTLYVFPGGQGDAALFGINGFNMLVDGGFSRKACFWDFARHLDRLDAVLLTRLNNSTVNGISAVLQRKKMNHVYPQIGHFFCNLQDRKIALSPDGDKDKDSLIVNLAEEGQEIVANLKHLALKPHPCYRDGNQVDPVNLYHKVGHGKLDMYVISPARDSQAVKEFLSKWSANDNQLFSNTGRKVGGKGFDFPIQNLVSICALLVWQPANPNDTITRILFPGSTPQHKIFEGLDKLRHLEFLKHPVCSARSISPSASALTVAKSLSRVRPGEDKPRAKSVENAHREPRPVFDPKARAKTLKTFKPPEKIKQKADTNKLAEEGEKISEESALTGTKKMESRIFEKDEKIENITKEIQKIQQENAVQRMEVDGRKADKNEEDTEKQTKKVFHRSKYDMKNVKSKVDSRAPSRSVDRKKVQEKKAEGGGSPPGTPKKAVTNGTATKTEKSRSLSRTGRSSPGGTPGKSIKDANNRKVVEARVISRTSKPPMKGKEATPSAAPVTAAAVPAKIERKPISRRPRAASPPKKAAHSPVRVAKTKTTKLEADAIVKKVKRILPSELGTDSTVSTPSAEVDSLAAGKKSMEATVEPPKDAQEAKTDLAVTTEAGAIKEVEESNSTENKETDEEAVRRTEVAEEEAVKESVASIEIEMSRKDEGEEEYLIITKEESTKVEDTEGDSLQEDAKTRDETEGEGEIKKIHRDEEDSEKKRKIKEMEGDRKEADEEKEKEEGKGVEEEEETIPHGEDDTSAEKQVKDKKEDGSEESPRSSERKDAKEAERLADLDEGIDLREPVSKEHKEGGESLPDEKFSTTVETSATTAPTLPEDEKIEEAEKKDKSEEKQIEEGKMSPDKEEERENDLEQEPIVEGETKEEDKEMRSVQPGHLEKISTPSIPAPVELVQHKIHPRDLVKTPDEVADLPVHEEVDPGMYSSNEFSKDLQRKKSVEEEAKEERKGDLKDIERGEAKLLDEEEPDEEQGMETLPDEKDSGKETEQEEAEGKDFNVFGEAESLTSKYLDIIDQLERSSCQTGKTDETKSAMPSGAPPKTGGSPEPLAIETVSLEGKEKTLPQEESQLEKPCGKEDLDGVKEEEAGTISTAKAPQVETEQPVQEYVPETVVDELTNKAIVTDILPEKDSFSLEQGSPVGKAPSYAKVATPEPRDEQSDIGIPSPEPKEVTSGEGTQTPETKDTESHKVTPITESKDEGSRKGSPLPELKDVRSGMISPIPEPKDALPSQATPTDKKDVPWTKGTPSPEPKEVQSGKATPSPEKEIQSGLTPEPRDVQDKGMPSSELKYLPSGKVTPTFEPKSALSGKETWSSEPREVPSDKGSSSPEPIGAQSGKVTPLPENQDIYSSKDTPTPEPTGVQLNMIPSVSEPKDEILDKGTPSTKLKEVQSGKTTPISESKDSQSSKGTASPEAIDVRSVKGTPSPEPKDLRSGKVTPTSEPKEVESGKVSIGVLDKSSPSPELKDVDSDKVAFIPETTAKPEDESPDKISPEIVDVQVTPKVDAHSGEGTASPEPKEVPSTKGTSSPGPEDVQPSQVISSSEPKDESDKGISTKGTQSGKATPVPDVASDKVTPTAVCKDMTSHVSKQTVGQIGSPGFAMDDLGVQPSGGKEDETQVESEKVPPPRDGYDEKDKEQYLAYKTEEVPEEESLVETTVSPVPSTITPSVQPVSIEETPHLRESVEEEISGGARSGKETPESDISPEIVQSEEMSTPALSSKAVKAPDDAESGKKITPGHTTPVMLEEARTTPEAIGVTVSGKATPVLSEKTTSGKATPVLSDKETSGKATPALSEGTSGKATPETSERLPSGKGTPSLSEKSISGKASPDISDRVMPATPSMSGKGTPSLSDKLTEDDMSGKSTPAPEKGSIRSQTSGRVSEQSDSSAAPDELHARDRESFPEDVERFSEKESSEKGSRYSSEEYSGKSTPDGGRRASKAGDSDTGENDPSTQGTPISSEKDVSENITPASSKGTTTPERDREEIVRKGSVSSASASSAEEVPALERLPSGKSTPKDDDTRPETSHPIARDMGATMTPTDDKETTKPSSTAGSSALSSAAASPAKIGKMPIAGTATPPVVPNQRQSLTNGFAGSDEGEELEKGILESERHEKESQITDDISSGEDEELKALEHAEDADDSESEGGITRERLQSLTHAGMASKTPESEGTSPERQKGMTPTMQLSPKGKKDDINDMVKSGIFSDNKAAVRRMLVTASSEDGGGEIEICPQGSITLSKTDIQITGEISDNSKEEGEEEFGALITQAREEYNRQRSRVSSTNTPDHESSDEHEADEEDIDLEGKDKEEFGSLILQARMEYDMQRARKSSRNSPDEEATSAGKVECTADEKCETDLVDNSAKAKEGIAASEEVFKDDAKAGPADEPEISQKDSESASKDASVCSTISQEDLTSRKDSSTRLEDIRSSSVEVSPLKTTYITSGSGDADPLMTSSFYSVSGREEEVLEYRREKGYESFTQIGPDGEKTEKTYFYTADPEAATSSVAFMKGIPESIPEAPEMTFETFPTRDSFLPEDFSKAVDEHRSTRGEYLGQPPGGRTAPQVQDKEKDREKDVIEGWGKPLGLPLPPKNARNAAIAAGQNISTTSSLSTPTDNSDSVTNWGHPMNLPSPAPPPGQSGNPETPKKDKPMGQTKKAVLVDNRSSGNNTPSRRSESPVKQPERRPPSIGRNKTTGSSFLYLDLTYVPHHGNSYYSNVEFFKRVRARYYVFSGTEPSKEVYNALLEAKQTWEDKDLEVTIIPTYDTDVLGYWVAENEETLAKNKIDLSPSASRCTINLQDHETSCSAYRLEF